MIKAQSLAKHPYQIIQNLVLKHGPGVRLEFGRYEYTPQTAKDVRRCFYVQGSELSSAWVTNTINSLAEREELALHSRIFLPNGEVRHIPMIDFACALNEHGASTLVSSLEGLGVDYLSIYRSGRSYHGYGRDLISEKDWPMFMGSILLANLPGAEHVVDCRWVGHRLRAGYATLRWSCNTPQYVQLPEHTLNLSLSARLAG